MSEQRRPLLGRREHASVPRRELEGRARAGVEAVELSLSKRVGGVDGNLLGERLPVSCGGLRVLQPPIRVEFVSQGRVRPSIRRVEQQRRVVGHPSITETRALVEQV